MPYGFFVEVNAPVDPGFGGGTSGLRPDNSLPPGIPPIGVTLPEPPPGVWPPPDFTRPILPIGPDNTLPVEPGTIWPPPGRPPHVDVGLPTPPAGTLPIRPPSGKFWVVCGIPGVGWRYVCVDPSLVVGNPIAPTPTPKA